eukprot:CAMPEP_0174295636 /NCGR_PEP_ID=MMETSP0809-20121228/45434_1 /TAXON_ID=73025 ORGANISM="Eutreptiella gymnastica-like, Strain CCMP1594" /NCGR_SAMPLE_ID=MMETSP0809 /ASSEMBLY_ACC=CAM_ASM_000658 /LENGTH=41 /DNA_ID= /DNA_START= /DNA_END= /DNA_ORIENTATION=
MHCLNLLPQDFAGPFLAGQRLAQNNKAADQFHDADLREDET